MQGGGVLNPSPPRLGSPGSQKARGAVGSMLGGGSAPRKRRGRPNRREESPDGAEPKAAALPADDGHPHLPRRWRLGWRQRWRRQGGAARASGLRLTPHPHPGVRGLRCPLAAALRIRVYLGQSALGSAVWKLFPRARARCSHAAAVAGGATRKAPAESRILQPLGGC